MSKIDLVIPTYNRTDYLKRILDYYTPYAKDFDIIIADSSFPKNKERNKKLIKTYAKLNILHLNKFSEKLEQHHKFAEMIKYVSTKYCVFCADDDFIIPNGVKEGVKFLKSHPDYSAAHGTYISFYVQKNLLGEKQFMWRYLYSLQSDISPNPLERVAHHLENFTLALWAVQRTDAAKICHREFVKANIDPYLLPVLGELLPDCLTAVYGKIKYLKNTFYSARECFSQILGSYPSLIDAKKEGIYDREIGKFKKCLVGNIRSEYPSFKENTFESRMNIALEKYIKIGYQEHLMAKINNLLRRSPKIVSRGFLNLHINYLFSKPKNGPLGLIDKPQSKYYNDFDEIRRCVLNH